jgi:putative ABC transport system ATP-binding protein
MGHIVALKNVTKDYPLGSTKVPALRGVTCNVEDGEFLAIAGPSGSGKTTVLNLIGCVDRPTSGTVEVVGRDVGGLSDRALTELRLQVIGFIFQSFNLVSVLSVFQNVELPLLLQRRHSAVQRRARVLALLERVGLRDYLKHRPSELSGGQRQRVAIARALVTSPRLVLADEPTANLDSVTGQKIIDLMKELNRDSKTTFVFSTHDSRVLVQASAVLRLADGKLVDQLSAPDFVKGTTALAAESR